MNKVTSNYRNNQKKGKTNQLAKFNYRKVLITILVILLIEAPQVISAWISLAEELSLFSNRNSLPTEVIQHRVK